MISSTAHVSSLQTAVQTLGLPILFGVFVLKGALVGKIFPTSVFLPGYVIASGVTVVDAAAVVVLVTIAHIIGQLFLYVGIRRYGESFVARVPSLEIDRESSGYRRLDDWFDRYGGAAIFATNVVPWSRGLIAVPAAMSSYPLARYSIHISVATVLYHSLYVGAAIAGLAIVT
jgi:membrane protein DedA with SNARE-associated domain